MAEIREMNTIELENLLNEVQEEIDEVEELNLLSKELVKLVNQKAQIEEELDRRLKYIEKALKH